MTINNEEHAALAVQVIKQLGELPNPEKQAVLKNCSGVIRKHTNGRNYSTNINKPF
jgi:hypothetical protein